MQRICFTLKIKPERLEEYRQRHREVWPEMQHALREAGWKDYSLFLRPDGTLIGYLKCESFAAALEAMAARDVNTRWQKEMAPFFVHDGPPDEAMQPLDEVFHLE